MVVSAAFSVLFLVSSELIPTVIRGRAFGLVCASGRIGSIVGMQVLKLDGIAKGWIFGSVSIAAAIATFMLSETFRQPLLQTLDEAEVQMSNKRFLSEEKTMLKEYPIIPSDTTVDPL